jgi:predicted glycoside hydrolase/deacetylase ChbG (UPF0249 family)
MMTIELHADDFGATKNVTRNIVTAWLAKGLDGVSVIANGDAINEAALQVNAHQDRPLRIVAHLNLSEGLPIASPSQVPLLIDRSGRLSHGFMGIWIKWLFSGKTAKQSLLYQIEIEWREQIKKVIETFSPRSVSGLDGHVHIHMLPFLFPIAVKLAKEFGLSEIRISGEHFHFSPKESLKIGFLVNVIKHVLLNLLAVPARKTINKNAISSADSVAGVLYSGFMTLCAVEAAIKAADCQKLNWIEIIFHPGKATEKEAHRWSNNPAIGKFYLDSQRDCERDVLLTVRKALSHLL